MEVTPFTVYLFTRLDSLNNLFGILFFVFLFIAGTFNFVDYIENEEFVSPKANIIFSLIIFFLWGFCSHNSNPERSGSNHSSPENCQFGKGRGYR